MPFPFIALRRFYSLNTRIAWTKIKPDIIEFLEEIRDARLEEVKSDSLSIRHDLFRHLVDVYTRNRPSNEIVPRAGDIYRMAGIEDLIEGTPHEELLTEDAFKDFFLHLPEFSHQWRQDKSQILLEDMRRAFHENPTYAQRLETSALSLATSFFRCIRCDRPMTYPYVLIHPCFTPSMGSLPLTTANHLGVRAGSRARSKATLFDRKTHDVVHHLIRLCGLGPATATGRDVDEKMALFSCARCSNQDDVFYVTWRMAASI